MALSSEQIYDELDGAEVKEILVTRLREMLNSVPDFQPHLTLPRVHMKLSVHLDIFGRRVPSLDLVNDLTLTTKRPVEQMTLAKELVAEDEVSADTGVPVPNTPFDGAGQPPDQVREEHGLRTLEPVKDRAGITQQRPLRAVGPDDVPSAPGGRRYAAFRKLEREGPVVMGHVEYLPGSEPIMKAPSQPDTAPGPAEKPKIGIQQDFREAHRTARDDRRPP